MIYHLKLRIYSRYEPSLSSRKALLLELFTNDTKVRLKH